jgi:hypothetical protein
LLGTTEALAHIFIETGRMFAIHPHLSVYPRLKGRFCGNHPNGIVFSRPSRIARSGGHNSGAYTLVGALLQDSMIAHDAYAFSWFCRTNERTQRFIDKR